MPCKILLPAHGGGGGLVAKSCPTLTTPWTVACQAPLSMGFTRQEYWNGLPFPSPADLPDPGIKPASPALAGRFFTREPPGKSLKMGGGTVVISIGMCSATQWATEGNSQRLFSSSRALSATRKHS